MRNILFVVLHSFGLFIYCVYCPVSNAADGSLRLSVVPQFTSVTIHRDWTPLIKEIESATGQQIELLIHESIPDFEMSILHGDPDIAYMNPYHAVMTHQAQGYIPIIRNGKLFLTGILLTRKNSPINTLNQLNGKVIAFPSPNAFAASLYMRALLSENRGIIFKARYVKTHSNAYRHALREKSDAAGSVYRILHKENKALQNSVKVLYETPRFPSHPLTVHPRIDVQLRKRIQQAFFDLNKTAKGKAILDGVFLSDPVAANYQQDYKTLESLKLDKYIIK